MKIASLKIKNKFLNVEIFMFITYDIDSMLTHTRNSSMLKTQERLNQLLNKYCYAHNN